MLNIRLIATFLVYTAAIPSVTGGALKLSHEKDELDEEGWLKVTPEKESSSKVLGDHQTNSLREVVTSLQNPEVNPRIKEEVLALENITGIVEDFKNSLESWSTTDPDILLTPANKESGLNGEEHKQINRCLWEGAKQGNIDIMKLALAKGADINFKITGDKSTPLIVATRENHLQAVKFLILNGADKEAVDRTNRSSLYLAALHSRDDIIQLLIREGVDVNQRVVGGRTALIVAAHENNPSSAKLLFRAGADPHITDDEGHDTSYYTYEHANRVLEEW